jgi:predicted RNase H-like HicB family nuclease
MLAMYPAVFYENELGGYTVIFPDLNSAITEGKDKQEAMEMAIDCLAGFLYTSGIDGEIIPKPSDILDINLKDYVKDIDYESNDAFVTWVSVEVEEYSKCHFKKSVRKTLTIPAWLDKEARKAKINFSKTLQEALLQKLHQ